MFFVVYAMICQGEGSACIRKTCVRQIPSV